MKKLLALVLALVMTLSLCTVTNAAFPDAADVDYKEAVDVMSAVGVFKGDEKGNFNPDANLTRETAAKLIAYLDLGEKVAEALPAVKVFSDVEANRWSAKYIAYCADAGYIAGVGDGSYNPTGELTGYAFGKLLLCVLGYDASIEGYTGASWSINVAKAMQKIDLANGVDKAASAVLTREEAAQYCLNALKATMVDYENKGTNVTINGAVIATGASKAADVIVAAADKYATIDATKSDGKDIVQLGEKLYNGDLKIVTSTTADAFGRPANEWQYKTESVGTYGTAEPVVTYTAPVTGGDIYTDLGKPKAADLAGLKLFRDGEEQPSFATWLVSKIVSGNKDKVNAQSPDNGNGILIEVYKVDGKYVVVAVDTFVGEITGWTAAKLDKNGDVTEKEKVTVTVTGIGSKTFETADFTKQDATDKTVVLVTGVTDGANVTVKSVKAAESKTIVATKQTATNFVADGTTYKYSNNKVGAIADTDVTNKTEHVVYFDEYGYVIKVADPAAAALNYAYVLNYGEEGIMAGDSTYYAKLLYTDATVATVKVTADASALKDHVVSYKDGTGDDEGKVVLTDAANSYAGSFAVSKNAATLQGATVNNKTAFVVGTTKDGKTVYNAYTGVANVPSMTATKVAGITKDGVWTAFFALSATEEAGSSTAKDITYVVGATKSAAITEVDLGTYYTYTAIVNGEIVEIKSTENLDGYYTSMTKDKNGVVTAATLGTVTDVAFATDIGISAEDEGVITIGSTAIVCNDASVFVVDGDDVTASDLASIEADANDAVAYYTTKGVVTQIVITKV